MRLGLIGAGRWGKRFIATIGQMAEVELVHLASGNEESARLIPPGCRLTSNWREVTANLTLDGIIVATPPATHAEIALAAIDAGLAVLVEKPVTLSLDEANKLIAAATRDSVLVMVDHTHLFSNAFQKLKAESRGLGRLLHILSTGSNWGPFRRDAAMLWDYAPHDIAMCLDLCGEYPKSVAIIETETLESDKGHGERISFELLFGGGARASIEVSNIDRRKQRHFEATFERGTLIYDDLATDKLVMKGPASGHTPSDHQVIAIDDTPPLTMAVAEFCAAIGEKSCFHPSLELGMEVVSVLTTCQAGLDCRHD